MKMTVGLDPQSAEEVRKNFKQYQLRLREERKGIVEKGLKIILTLWKLKLSGHHLTGEFESEATYEVDDHKDNFTIGKVGGLNASKNTAIGMTSLEYGHAFPNQGRDTKLEERNARREAGEKIKRSKKGTRWTDSIKKEVAAVPTIRPALDESRKPVRALVGSEIKRIIKGLPGGGD